MLRNIDADEALDMLCALPVRLELETIPLDDAHGRILARELRAPISVPPFDKSPYDGYAFRGEDTLSASQERPVTLKITEEIPAGKAPSVEITDGGTPRRSSPARRSRRAPTPRSNMSLPSIRTRKVTLSSRSRRTPISFTPAATSGPARSFLTKGHTHHGADARRSGQPGVRPACPFSKSPRS